MANGFGGGGFGGNSNNTNSGNNSGGGPRTSPGGGGGKKKKNHFKHPARHGIQHPGRHQGKGGGKGGGGKGGGNNKGRNGGISQISKTGQDLAFEAQDPETMRLGALGMLKRAGISTNAAKTPFGGNAIPFIEDTVNSWVDDHLGNVLTGNPEAEWGPYLDNRVPDERVKDFSQWRGRELGMDFKKFKHLKPKRRKHVRKNYGEYKDQLKARRNTKGGVPKNDPAWNKGIREKFTADWAAATPRTRGYESARWVGPKRTIQF
jgi:hypothetical protein